MSRYVIKIINKKDRGHPNWKSDIWGKDLKEVKIESEMAQAEGPARVKVPDTGRSLGCLRTSEEANVAEWAKEKAVEGRRGGNRGQVMWGLAGHHEDVGFFWEWEGTPLEGAGTEVRSVGCGARMSRFESCVCPSLAVWSWLVLSAPAFLHWWNAESHRTYRVGLLWEFSYYL